MRLCLPGPSGFSVRWDTRVTLCVPCSESFFLIQLAFFNIFRRISYTYRDGSACKSSCSTEAVFDASTTLGSSLYGDTYYHVFSLNINPKFGISSFTVSISEGKKASTFSTTFPIQDAVFWLPTASSLATDADGFVIGTIAAAVRPDQSFSPKAYLTFVSTAGLDSREAFKCYRSSCCPSISDWRFESAYHDYSSPFAGTRHIG